MSLKSLLMTAVPAKSGAGFWTRAANKRDEAGRARGQRKILDKARKLTREKLQVDLNEKQKEFESAKLSGWSRILTLRNMLFATNAMTESRNKLFCRV